MPGTLAAHEHRIVNICRDRFLWCCCLPAVCFELWLHTLFSLELKVVCNIGSRASFRDSTFNTGAITFSKHDLVWRSWSKWAAIWIDHPPHTKTKNFARHLLSYFFSLAAIIADTLQKRMHMSVFVGFEFFYFWNLCSQKGLCGRHPCLSRSW